MSRAYTLGNGHFLVCVDARGFVRDVYFPRIGQENHVGGRKNRVGVHVDGQLMWLDDASWAIEALASPDSMSGSITARNARLQISLTMRDVVYNEKDIFIREIVVTNMADRARAIHVFFGHEFQIQETVRGDTGYYDPRYSAIIHYEGRRCLMMSVEGDGVFDQYTLGNFGIEGKEGSFRDAEDGELSQNPIEHGVVDSVMRTTAQYEPHETKTMHYWLCAARYVHEVHDLAAYIREKTPAYLMRTATDYWRAWASTQGISFAGLSSDIVDLFKRSLFVIHAHADDGGAIIASSDSEILNQGRDTYAYAWPRDGGYAVRAMILAGDVNIAKQFFMFSAETITKDGYFMHKYLPDGSVGSSWHPWIRDGKLSLPIQQDETAIVLVALRDYYTISRDLEFVESIFNSLVKKSADFLVSYRDPNTKLPQPSYDLWEDNYGVSTYACGVTYAALLSAQFFARLLGKFDLAQSYGTAAGELQAAIMEHLYDPSSGAFYKRLMFDQNGVLRPDPTIDMASFFGIFAYGVLPPDDPRVISAMRIVEEKLELHNEVGGIPRYEGDMYYRTSMHEPPNPWIITTLWRAQYYLKLLKTEEELGRVRDILEWVVAHATPSGMLSEQIHPRFGTGLSATPLVWSHAEFVTTVIEYLQKLDDLGLCQTCYPLRRTKDYHS